MTKKETIDLRKIKADAESLVEKKEEDLVSREESFSIEYVAQQASNLELIFSLV